MVNQDMYHMALVLPFVQNWSQNIQDTGATCALPELTAEAFLSYTASYHEEELKVFRLQSCLLLYYIDNQAPLIIFYCLSLGCHTRSCHNKPTSA